MQFPILSVLIFLPILTGVLLLFLPAYRKNLVKWISLVSASLILLLSVIVFFSYDIAAGGYQLIERANWVPALGISYYVGIDGIGAPMVLLAGLVMFTGVMVSWGVDDRPREFFSFMMFLGASVLGVFCAMDLFMLFFCGARRKRAITAA